MEINPISMKPGGEISPLQDANLAKTAKDTAAGPADTFKDLLSTELNKVNTLSQNADKAIKDFTIGEPVDIHDVMIKMEEASLALQLTMQIRNKLVDAYQELNRMQI